LRPDSHSFVYVRPDSIDSILRTMRSICDLYVVAAAMQHDFGAAGASAEATKNTF